MFSFLKTETDFKDALNMVGGEEIAEEETITKEETTVGGEEIEEEIETQEQDHILGGEITIGTGVLKDWEGMTVVAEVLTEETTAIESHIQEVEETIVGEEETTIGKEVDLDEDNYLEKVLNTNEVFLFND